MKIIKLALFIISIAYTSNTSAQTVYTTKTGEKYHKTTCRFLKYSKKETTIKKAKALGYVACKVCKPILKNINNYSQDSTLAITPKKSQPKVTKKTRATQCTGKTKKGIRCKRKTKNTNGKCYQH